jgi:hypothetical protein
LQGLKGEGSTPSNHLGLAPKQGFVLLFLCVSPRYLRERRQFGAPLASFQLMQEKLARMLGNVNVGDTSCVWLVLDFAVCVF